MKPQYILTEQEYNDLINQSSNVFQEQRIIELETELDKYKIYKRSMELDGDQLAQAVVAAPVGPSDIQYPFEIQNDTLRITSNEYFVTLYNAGIATKLSDVDKDLFNYLAEVATNLSTSLCWSTVSQLKRHRVALQQELYKPTKVKGAVQLTAI